MITEYFSSSATLVMAFLSIVISIYITKDSIKWSVGKFLLLSLICFIIIFSITKMVTSLFPEKKTDEEIVDEKKSDTTKIVEQIVDPVTDGVYTDSMNSDKETKKVEPIKQEPITETQNENTTATVLATTPSHSQNTAPTTLSDVQKNIKVTITSCKLYSDELFINMQFLNVGPNRIETYFFKNYYVTITDQDGNVYESISHTVANLVPGKYKGMKAELINGEPVNGQCEFYTANKSITSLTSLKLRSKHQIFDIPFF